ncbi:MAG: prepilin peptidase [Deltaproteobacteria bacterium]|nr:prepilin peptidase [Deltaproteobacteria bacterium]
MSALAPIVASVAIGAASAVSDLATRRIPNVLTLGGIALGVAMHGAMGLVDGPLAALRGAAVALLGALLCGILPGIGFWRGEMGGGDVKLFAAIGALLGPARGFDAQAITFVVVLAVLWPWRIATSGAAKRWLASLVRRGEPRVDVPVARVVLGPAIFFGLCGSILRHGLLP